MKLVFVPPGEFQMGSSPDDPQGEMDEQPRHRVRISRGFYLGAYEVTQGEYTRVMGENPSWYAATGPGKKDVAGHDTSRFPVDFVNWDESVEFCTRLSALPEEKRAGRNYRLPTEAEWEYACRAGTTTRFACGDELSTKQANISATGVTGRAQRVGSYPPNAWGLHDMHGNVWEWCADRYSANAYQSAGEVDTQGPAEGTGRVVRGGDWHFGANFARSANRDLTRASRRDLGNGFRVVCEIKTL